MDYTTNALLNFHMCVLNAGGSAIVPCFLSGKINGMDAWMVLILQK